MKKNSHFYNRKASQQTSESKCESRLTDTRISPREDRQGAMKVSTVLVQIVCVYVYILLLLRSESPTIYIFYFLLLCINVTRVYYYFHNITTFLMAVDI